MPELSPVSPNTNQPSSTIAGATSNVIAALPSNGLKKAATTSTSSADEKGMMDILNKQLQLSMNVSPVTLTPGGKIEEDKQAMMTQLKRDIQREKDRLEEEFEPGDTYGKRSSKLTALEAKMKDQQFQSDSGLKLA